MTQASVRCSHCCGEHEPDPPDVYIDFRGWRWRAAFRCLCCGVIICARQWAFGRGCGKCDTGACHSDNRYFQPEYGHVHPEWYRPYDGQATVDAAAAACGAERLAQEVPACPTRHPA